MMPEVNTSALPDRQIEWLHDAGAAPEMVAYAAPPLPEGDRPLTWKKLRMTLAEAEEMNNPVDYVHQHAQRMGGFGTALWDGEVGDAWIRADFTNARALMHLFSPEYVEACIVAEDLGDIGYAKQKVEYGREHARG